MKNLWKKLKKHHLIYLIAGITVAVSLSGCSTDSINDADKRFIGIAVLCFFIFILIREIICWFYKTNAILEKIEKMRSNIEHKLEENNIKLKEIENQLQELKKQQTSNSNSEKN